MNRYKDLKTIFYETIEQKCHGIYKEKAYFHSIQVASLCQIYAKHRHLDIELASIIGLFHDYAQFINQSSFNHAIRSAQMLEKYLIDFSKEEVAIITHAIARHSDKDHIDDSYSELIKDMDILAKYYDDPSYVFKDCERKRLDTLQQ